MSEHTWIVYPAQADFKAEEIREAGSHAKIATLAPGWPRKDTDCHARLMAAAPELLKALQKIATADISNGTVRYELKAIARAAIEKAGPHD